MKFFAIFGLLVFAISAQEAPVITLPPLGAEPPPPQQTPPSPQQSKKQPSIGQVADAMTQKAIDDLHRQLGALKTEDEPDRLKQAYLNFNLGVNYQRMGQDDSAAKHYLAADDLGSDSREIQARAKQNLGVMKHAKARAKLMEDPDAALKLLAEAQTRYREAMRLDRNVEGVAENQERALTERRIMKQIKEMQEKMQEKMEDAQDKTEEAHEAQQEANQASSGGDQPQKQQKQQKQQEAQEKTEAAEQAMQDLADEARKQGMEDAAKQVEQAKENVKKAHKAQEEAMAQEQGSEQRKASEEEAEDALDEAMSQIGVQPEPEEGEGEPQEGTGEEGEEGEGEEGDADGEGEKVVAPSEDEPKDESESEAVAGEESEEEEDFDKMSALARLQAIQENEKDFKEFLKAEQMKKRARQGAVPKNW
jgi:hypothetical protein